MLKIPCMFYVSRVWQAVTWTKIRQRHSWCHRPRSGMVELLSSRRKFCCRSGRCTEHECTRACFAVVCGTIGCTTLAGELMSNHEVVPLNSSVQQQLLWNWNLKTAMLIHRFGSSSVFWPMLYWFSVRSFGLQILTSAISSWDFQDIQTKL